MHIKLNKVFNLFCLVFIGSIYPLVFNNDASCMYPCFLPIHDVLSAWYFFPIFVYFLVSPFVLRYEKIK